MVASSKPGSVGTDKPVIFNHNELVVISSVQNYYGLEKYVPVKSVFKFTPFNVISLSFVFLFWVQASSGSLVQVSVF